MDDHEAFRRQVRKTMFENGIPVGSDDPKLNLLGSPPLHLCDPDVACDLCGRYPTSTQGEQT